MIPADKKAIPRQHRFVNGKYYGSIIAFGSTGIERYFYLNKTPDFAQEMTDPYVIERALSLKTKGISNFRRPRIFSQKQSS